MTNEQRNKKWLEMREESYRLDAIAQNFRTKLREELFNFQQECTHTYDTGKTAVVEVYGKEKCLLCFAEGNLHLPKIKKVKILNFNSHLEYNGKVEDEYKILIGQEFNVKLEDQHFGTIWIINSNNSRIRLLEGEYEILETF